jgi:hypothetical protein
MSTKLNLFTHSLKNLLSYFNSFRNIDPVLDDVESKSCAGASPLIQNGKDILLEIASNHQLISRNVDGYQLKSLLLVFTDSLLGSPEVATE